MGLATWKSFWKEMKGKLGKFNKEWKNYKQITMLLRTFAKIRTRGELEKRGY